MQPLLLAIDKCYNSIKYNGFYIFLSLLFPFVIYKLDAGEELLWSMSEKRFGINISLTVVAFTALAFSIWCIPTLAIKLFRWVVRMPGATPIQSTSLRIRLFNTLIKLYNDDDKADAPVSQQPANVATAEQFEETEPDAERIDNKKQIPIRYISVAPWVLFICTCVRVFYGKWMLVPAAIALVGLLWFIYHIKDKVNQWYDRQLLFDAESRTIHLGKYSIWVAVPLVLNLAIAFGLDGLVNEGTRSYLNAGKALLVGLNVLFLALFYSCIQYLENRKLNDEMAYRLSDLNYKALLLTIGLTMLSFFVLNQSNVLGIISPVVVIIFCACGLIVVAELLFTAQQLLISVELSAELQKAAAKKPVNRGYVNVLTAYKYALITALLFVISISFFSAINSHRVRVVQLESPYDPATRPSLTAYFDAWYKALDSSDAQPTVYLVSGQGGGSRAAAHFFMTMSILDSCNPGFFNHIFSLSTASGSTTGANMYLAAKYNHYHVNTDIRQHASQLYGRNYMSSAFFGMMLGDGIEHFTSLGADYPDDRNTHLQEEERKAFRETFGDSDGGYFNNDYMHVYRSGKHWPLFMINTTVVDNGTRAVFSPVPTESFSLATDVYGNFKVHEGRRSRGIPMVTAVNQSQAFPLLSAYNFVDCVGRLGDGGIVENTGCATTLEIYRVLRAYCNQTGRRKVRFVCLNMLNSTLDPSNTPQFKRSSILNTVTAAIQSPFDGNQVAAYENLKRQINYLNHFNDANGADLEKTFQLSHPITLTRTLSIKSIDEMYRQIHLDPSIRRRLP